jgi:hypothetical protein
MLKVFDDVGNTSVLVEHFLVVASALVGTSVTDEVAHHDLDFYFSSILQWQIEQFDIG